MIKKLIFIYCHCLIIMYLLPNYCLLHANLEIYSSILCYNVKQLSQCLDFDSTRYDYKCWWAASKRHSTLSPRTLRMTHSSQYLSPRLGGLAWYTSNACGPRNECTLAQWSSMQVQPEWTTQQLSLSSFFLKFNLKIFCLLDKPVK